MPNTDLFLKNDRCLLLAYDQGFEHGPVDFNEKNIDPALIVDIAGKSGVFTGLVFHEGIAEKYYPIGGVEKKNYPPLILKLNGKTAFHKGEEPLSLQLTSVARAKLLGASGVGYTVYVGSEHEEQMMAELAKIVDEAHAENMCVIAWMYPRGKHVEGKEESREVVAYAARLGLELGADMVKLPYPGSSEDLAWAVKAAGKTRVLVQGGSKKTEAEFLSEATAIMQAGATGMAVGRNIWQSDDPVSVSKKLADVVFK